MTGPEEAEARVEAAEARAREAEAKAHEAEARAHEAADRAIEAASKAEENWDLFLRARADLDNYKRRVERDLGSMVRRGKQDLILRLLDVVDSLERAAAWEDEHGQGPDERREGIALILRQLHKVLSDTGVARIEALGERFDPVFHEAVATDSQAEAPEDTITAVFQAGYTYEGEVLRPARVSVSRPAGS